MYAPEKSDAGAGRYDVFVSYAHDDTSIVKPVVAALTRAGLGVWFDQTSVKAFTGISASIEAGIANSKVLLAFYSRRYAQSRPCQWELATAFLQAQHHSSVTDRILVLNTSSDGDHIQPIELRDALFVSVPDSWTRSALRRLAELVKERLHAIDTPIAGDGPAESGAWYGIEPVGSSRFVGRTRTMWAIHSALHSSQYPIVSGETLGRAVLLRGLGGMGKSLTAEEYGRRFGAAYPGGVFWLNALGSSTGTTESVWEAAERERITQLRSFASRLDIYQTDLSSAEVEGAVRRRIEALGRPVLWIVDDLPANGDADAVRPWFGPPGLAKTLITSRAGREYDALVTAVHLNRLTSADGYKLLTSGRTPTGEEEAAAARGIVSDLGGHSLAIDVARGMLQHYSGHRSFTEFRAELSDPGEDVLEVAAEFAGELPNGHETSIAATLWSSIAQLGPEGEDFLRLASTLAPAPIPPSLVKSAFKRVEDLVDREATAYALEGRRQVDTVSLAETIGDAGEERLIHGLVSRTVSLTSGWQSRRDTLCLAAGRALVEELSPLHERIGESVTVEEASRLTGFIAHARAVAECATTAIAAELLGLIGRYEYLRGSYRAAMESARREADLLTELDDVDVDEARRLRAASQYAQALTITEGDLDMARQILDDVIQRQLKLLGRNHRDTLRTGERRIRVAAALGFAGAEIKQRDVVETRKRVFGRDDPETLASMTVLSQYYAGLGMGAEALGTVREALDRQLEILGPEHPDTLASMNDLAVYLNRSGKAKAAVAMHEKVLARRERVLGPEHPLTTESKKNLSWALHRSGRHQRARGLAVNALETHCSRFGIRHVVTMGVARLLCEILEKAGDWSECQRTFAKHLGWLFAERYRYLDPSLKMLDREIQRVDLQWLRPRSSPLRKLQRGLNAAWRALASRRRGPVRWLASDEDFDDVFVGLLGLSWAEILRAIESASAMSGFMRMRLVVAPRRKRRAGFGRDEVLVVGMDESNHEAPLVLSFALVVGSDLVDDLGKATAEDLIRAVVDRFGVPLRIGDRVEKLFMREGVTLRDGVELRHWRDAPEGIANVVHDERQVAYPFVHLWLDDAEAKCRICFALDLVRYADYVLSGTTRRAS